MGLTIANEVKRQSKYRPEVSSFERILARTRIVKIAGEVLTGHPQSLAEFSKEMRQKGVDVQEAVNKKGNTYGLRFIGYGQTFKASQIVITSYSIHYTKLYDAAVPNQQFGLIALRQRIFGNSFIR